MPRFIRAALLLGAALSFCVGAQAQMFRAYLASYGNDANPCTVAAPCRLLPAALNAVANGGEIWILDSANFNQGMVNIAKSVTIQAIPGQIASVVAVGGNGAISIDAAGIKVVLRNLVISNNASNPGAGGIYVIQADTVAIENSVVAGIVGHAVRAFGFPSHIAISDTVIRGASMAAVSLSSGPTLTVTRSRFHGNLGGVFMDCGTSGVTAYLSDTVISGNSNTGTGVSLTASGTSNCWARAFLTRVTIADMADGVYVESANNGTTAIAQLNRTTIAGNTGRGFAIVTTNASARIESLGNNDISDNAGGDDGALTPVAQR